MSWSLLVPPGHGSGPSWSLPTLRPGPGSGCTASCTCRANLPCARSCSSRNSIPVRFLGPLPDFRISLSLSLPLCLSASCLLSLSSVPPTFFALWYMHLHHVRSLSTNWHLLGSDRDTKTKLGTNPSEPNHLVQSTWSQDRHSRELLALFTPRPRPAPSFSLCFGCAHLVFPWPPPSLFLFDCNARNYPSLSHTYPAVASHTRPPCPSLDTRCDVQPHHYSTLDHSPAQPERAALTTNGLEYRCRQPAFLI